MHIFMDTKCFCTIESKITDYAYLWGKCIICNMHILYIFYVDIYGKYYVYFR